MTGAGTAAALGYPDYGLVTMSEMAANAARIVAAGSVPVIADADTGYGNGLNAIASRWTAYWSRLSMSTTSPAVLGERRVEFEAALRAALEPYAENGMLAEEVRARGQVYQRD